MQPPPPCFHSLERTGLARARAAAESCSLRRLPLALALLVATGLASVINVAMSLNVILAGWRR
jgi:hypothetical protein